MSKDPSAAEKARRAESKAEGFQKININLGTPSGGSKGGFKKAGFRNAFGSEKTEGEESSAGGSSEKTKEAEKQASGSNDIPMPDAITEVTKIQDGEESDWDQDEDAYDPRKPTGCSANCHCHNR